MKRLYDNMPKISVLFKHTRSKVRSDLTYLWYYEYSYPQFKKTDKTIFKNSKKIQISSVPYDCIAELYEECQTIFNDDAVVVIGTSLSNLFE